MENWNECNCCYWVELSAWAENTVKMTAPGDYALIDKDAHHLLTVLANLKGSELVAIYQAMKELEKKRRITKAAGTALFLIGFVFMFGEARTAGAQIACSLGAAALCLIGGEMISRTLEEDGK